MNPFARARAASVAPVGEQELIRRIRRWLGPACPPAPTGIGDDCAVLGAGRGPRLVTVDPVVYGRHFDASIPARAVGEKLLKRNLSDIAAMGGRPEAAVVALLLDRRVRVDWLEGFYRGLAACARRFGVSVVGGDVAEAEGVLAASLTLLGTTPARPLLRTGARVGDRLYVTGLLGRSVATGHHYTFTPRLAEGAWLAARPEVRAMMDLSDGLAKDVWALTPPGAAPAVRADLLPIRRGNTLSPKPGGGVAEAELRSALGEGEDYELLFAVAAKADRGALERAWKAKFPRLPLSCIGALVRGGHRPADAIQLERYRGYEHLR